MEIAIVLSLLFIAIILFASNKISFDLITLTLLALLCATRILTPAEAFASFGGDFIIILASIFVISRALQQNGMLDLFGSRLLKIARTNPAFLITYVMCAVGITSAFMFNTAVTAVFLAPVLVIAKRMKTSSSKLLMPVAFASIVGGTSTLIGTSTNIAVNGYLQTHGLFSLKVFEFFPIGLALFLVTLLYMVLIGRRMLPANAGMGLTEELELRKYVTEVIINPGSDLVGQRIFRSDLSKMGFRILNVIRGENNFIPDQSTAIWANDLLIVEGDIANLLTVKETVGIEIRADVLVKKEIQNEKTKLAEVLVTPQCDFINATLKHANFRQRYGLVVLAINRKGQTLNEKIGSITLKLGDILLVQGPVDRINYYKSSAEMTIMEDFKPLLYKERKGFFTLFVFLAAIAAATFQWLPLSVGLLFATILVIINEAITIEEAYESVDWRLLILIGGMSAFGTAMAKSGAAAYLSQHILSFCTPYGMNCVLAGFIILTVILTQPMGNAAAALIILPIALQASTQLGINPKTFSVAVMLSASLSFITPLEPSCKLIYGPGNYRFSDFIKVGLPLTILLIAVLMVLVPYFFPY